MLDIKAYYSLRSCRGFLVFCPFPSGPVQPWRRHFATTLILALHCKVFSTLYNPHYWLLRCKLHLDRTVEGPSISQASRRHSLSVLSREQANIHQHQASVQSWLLWASIHVSGEPPSMCVVSLHPCVWWASSHLSGEPPSICLVSLHPCVWWACSRSSCSQWVATGPGSQLATRCRGASQCYKYSTDRFPKYESVILVDDLGLPVYINPDFGYFIMKWRYEMKHRIKSFNV